MRMTVLITGLLALTVHAGCDDGGGCPGPSGTSPDTATADTVPHDAQDDGAGPADAAPDGAGPWDAAPGEVAAPDTWAPNTPPSFGPLPAVDLDMGSSTTLGLAELMADDEDPDSALTMSWSADHVALQDGPGHALLVVSPVDWWGIETIPITLTDSGGLTATADLVVTVNEVVPVVEPPPETCGEVVFSYAAPAAQLVELAGTFNDWTPEPMADADGDGTWELTKVLDPGAWEYKFVVDGAWKTDPTNPNKVSDGYGGHNSLLEVPACPAE
jgi:hypothetical protein